ncbi:MAG: L-seryl-tRNA(Sec) selenium transferase, partial [Acidimicrobiia bacterium]
RHPVARAMRMDGATLAALEMTLEAYANRTARDLPLWTMATLATETLQTRCQALAAAIGNATVTAGASTIGAGSVPGAEIPGPVVVLAGKGETVFSRLLAGDPPVVARREAGDLVIDLRTVPPERDAELISLIRHACQS